MVLAASGSDNTRRTSWHLWPDESSVCTLNTACGRPFSNWGSRRCFPAASGTRRYLAQSTWMSLNLNLNLNFIHQGWGQGNWICSLYTMIWAQLQSCLFALTDASGGVGQWKKRLNVNVICYLCVCKSSALPHSTRKRTATVNPKLQIILCFLSDHQVIVISVSFSLGAHLRPRQSDVPQLSALRGRYGTRFERWWPHYYNLMVYVSEEVMFLSRSPSQQKAVCCSYLARPAAGTNLQCIKQATTHTHTNTGSTQSRVCVRDCENEQNNERGATARDS